MSGKPRLIPIICDWCGEDYNYTYGPSLLKKNKRHFCPQCRDNGITSNTKHGFAARNKKGQQANEYEMWKDARSRAKRHKIPFTIDPWDIIITENCPVLSIPLIRQSGKGAPSDNSPTLDKIIPEKGYVKDNIVVVSYKANSMKRNATIEEVMMLAEFYKQYL